MSLKLSRRAISTGLCRTSASQLRDVRYRLAAGAAERPATEKPPCCAAGPLQYNLLSTMKGSLRFFLTNA